MRQINLLPKSEQKELMLYFFSKQLMTFMFWAVASLLLFAGLIFIAKAYLSAQVAEIDGQIAQQRQILRSSDNEILKQQVESLNSQTGAISNLLSQHYYWSSALEELARLLSADINLDSIILDRVTGEVQIKGVAGQRESVLKFWSDVHKSEFFTDIDFPLANLQNATQDPFGFTFSVQFAKLKEQP